MPENAFTNRELHVISVALDEFWTSLNNERYYMEKNPQTTNEEIDELIDLMDTADDLIAELEDIMEGIDEYV